MTTTSTPEKDEKVAAAGAIGLGALLFGPVGAVIAALAVGIERTVGRPLGRGASDPEAREQARELRTARVAAELARSREWLARDRAAYEQLRAQRRKYFQDQAAGRDPGPQPAVPNVAVRTGAAVKRWFHRGRTGADRAAGWASKVKAAATDFRDGFRDGWAAAKPKAKEGFKAAVAARPEPQAPPTTPTESPSTTTPGGTEAVPDENVTPQGPEQDNQDRHVELIIDNAPRQAPLDKNTAPPEGGTEYIADPAAKPATEPSTNGDSTMALPTAEQAKTAGTTNAAPQGEDLASRIVSALILGGNHVGSVTETIDVLSNQARALRAAAQRVTEVAGNDATTATTQAVDGLNSAAAGIEAAAGHLSELAASADELVQTAIAGMKPAEEARDAIHAAGGTGELLSTSNNRE